MNFWKRTLPALLAVFFCLPTQAQLIIDVFPSQDDPTKTIWLFGIRDRFGNTQSGTSTVLLGSTIRSSGNFHRRDSWTTSTYLFTANKPTNQFLNLTPLFSSANHPKDIDSITRRLPGHGFGILTTNVHFFPSNVTNEPTIEAYPSTTKTIGSIFMNDDADDQIGIRGTSGANLAYTNGQGIKWFGSGILNKPISDFRTHRMHGTDFGMGAVLSPYFGETQISTHNYIIPEPAEYALVFGLLALAFVMVRRRFLRL